MYSREQCQDRQAARAGETGRGFAVVASEGRNLAQQSQISVTEIGTVIAKKRYICWGKRSKRTGRGSRCEEILLDGELITDQVTQIAQFIELQSTEAGEANSALLTIDENAKKLLRPFKS